MDFFGGHYLPASGQTPQVTAEVKATPPPPPAGLPPRQGEFVQPFCQAMWQHLPQALNAPTSQPAVPAVGGFDANAPTQQQRRVDKDGFCCLVCETERPDAPDTFVDRGGAGATASRGQERNLQVWVCRHGKMSLM